MEIKEIGGCTMHNAIHNRLKPGKWNGALSERKVADRKETNKFICSSLGENIRSS